MAELTNEEVSKLIEDQDKLIELSKKGNGFASYYLALKLIDSDEYEQALQLLDLASQQAPEYDAIYLLYGFIYENGFGTEVNDHYAYLNFKIASDLGNGYASRRLGDINEKQGDYKKAFEFYQLALTQDETMIDCYNNLGGLYLKGLGVKADYDKGIHFLEEGSSKGDAYASYNLGDIHYGDGEYEEALKYYMLAAKQNDTLGLAFGSIGHMYLDGLGVEVDKDKAYEYFIKGAEQGDPKSSVMVGDHYFFDLEDYPKALRYFLLAIHQNTDELGTYDIVGEIYSKHLGDKCDLKKAEKYYKKAIELGYNNSIYNLALMYNINHMYKKALKYFNMSLEHHIQDDYCNLMIGLYLLYGAEDEIAQDVEKSFTYLKEASKLGRGEASLALGETYYSHKDFQNALLYLTKAHEQNYIDTDGLTILYNIYHRGEGVEKDEEKALMYANEIEQ